MYFCFWKNCDNSTRRIKYFRQLKNCLKYADKIKYVTCGDHGHDDVNYFGAHYFEIGKEENGVVIDVYLRIHHHWDDSCNGNESDSESASESESDS